ncbi:MAG: METTL5 family protein, partial [Halobacteria archaeon]|nr:METTL5 family protein [Halobacteria archaeon]
MDRKTLEIRLERVEGFKEPSPELEQYSTPSHLASRILHFASMNGDLDSDSPVVDLGCGTGIFAIGAGLLGASAVGVDIDAYTLKTARENAHELGVADDTEWVRADVSSLCLDLRDATVVMNPPFGAQSRGADRPFLETAERFGRVVYSIHNEGSLDFVEGFVNG